MKRYLVFNAKCSACSNLARSIEDGVGDKLEAISIHDSKAITLLNQAYPEGWEHAPYLVTIDEGRVRAWRDLAMTVQLGWLMGPRQAWRVWRLARQTGIFWPFNTSKPSAFAEDRRRFLKGETMAQKIIGKFRGLRGLVALPVILGLGVIAMIATYTLTQVEEPVLAVEPVTETARGSTVVSVTQDDGEGAATVVNLVSREITLEELTRLAPFEILWPKDLPKGYQLLRVMDMSESWAESSNSGIFYLEYINLNDQDRPLSDQSRLFIWQYLKTTQSLPDLDGKQSIDTLRLADGTEIPVYESEGDRSKRAFLERGQVNLELVFWGMPVEDVEGIASSLAAN